MPMSRMVRVNRTFALREATEILLKAQTRSFPAEVIMAFASVGSAWATLALGLDADDFIEIEVDLDALDPVKLEYGPAKDYAS